MFNFCFSHLFFLHWLSRRNGCDSIQLNKALSNYITDDSDYWLPDSNERNIWIYSCFGAHSTIGIFWGGQKAHSSSVFCDNVVFAPKNTKKERKRERRRRKEFLEQKRLFILTEFNNPKSYGNQIGYHMKCRHSLPEKNSFTSPFETP